VHVLISMLLLVHSSNKNIASTKNDTVNTYILIYPLRENYRLMRDNTVK